jgi:hypothetical protein
LFARECDDISCAGDLEEVEIVLGFRTERAAPKPRLYENIDFDHLDPESLDSESLDPESLDPESLDPESLDIGSAPRPDGDEAGIEHFFLVSASSPA